MLGALGDLQLWDEFDRTLEDALSIDPESHSIGLLALQRAYARGANEDIDRLVHQLADRTESPKFMNGLARGLGEHLDDPVRARRVLEEGHRRWPDDPTTLANLGILTERAGGSGAADLREASRLRPDDGFVRFVLARALLREGMVEEAVTEARAAVALAPDASYAELIASVARVALAEGPGSPVLAEFLGDDFPIDLV